MSDNQENNTTQILEKPSVMTASRIIAKYQNSTVDDISNETPAVIAAEQTLLAAKLHEASAIVIQAEVNFSKKWLEVRKTCETDGQAKIKIKLEPEFAELQMAKNNEKTVIALIQSLKKLLASKTEEFRNQF